jgi:pSer/pThr/pTyr-binding forkhead associated (FHA) protein
MKEALLPPSSDEDFNEWEADLISQEESYLQPFGIDFAVYHDDPETQTIESNNQFTTTGGSWKGGDVDDPKSD